VLLCLTANHRNASYDLLEKLSFGAQDATAELVRSVPDVHGAVVLATCNRFEAYLEVADGTSDAATSALVDAVSRASDVASAVTKAFTDQTGIKVNWNYIQWDSLQTKIAAAAESHSYFADVADVDWSKVGEYYATKWFMPLNKYFPLSSVRSQFPQAPAFIRNGQLMGMPMDGSLLVTNWRYSPLGTPGNPSNFQPTLPRLPP